MSQEVFDLLIVGGGPVGLFGSFYAGLRGMKTKIVDSLEELGGQLATLYPEKFVFDVAGFPKILARDLAKNLVEQAMEYKPTLALGETVQGLHRDEALGAYCITSDKGTHYARTVLLAAGAGAFSPKKIPLPEALQWEGKGVYYFVKSKSIFDDKRVLIIGGGDSAIDWTLNLQDVASHVTLIHRRDQFRAHEDSVHKVLRSGAQVLTFWELKAIQAADGKIEAAVIINNKTNEERTLAVDAILVQVGFSSDLGPIKNWPIKCVGKAIEVNSHMETNLPGIFAAGDVAHFDGKLKLIVTGFGEAATAVNYAKTLIDPKAKAFPGHSSEMTPQAPMITFPGN